MAPTPSDAAPATLHTVFTSECHNPQFDWFATGVYRSHRESGIRGRITRLLACGADDLAQYRGLGLGPTFVHPNYRHNPLNGDTSASYRPAMHTQSRLLLVAPRATVVVSWSHAVQSTLPLASLNEPNGHGTHLGGVASFCW